MAPLVVPILRPFGLESTWVVRRYRWRALEYRCAPPLLTIEPASALLDEPVDIRLTSLVPGARVTLTATMTDHFGRRWQSAATFVADDAGVVESRRTPRPAAATPGPTRWASSGRCRRRPGSPPLRADARPARRAHGGRRGAGGGGGVPRARLLAPGVAWEAVREGDLAGRFFRPPGPGPHRPSSAGRMVRGAAWVARGRGPPCSPPAATLPWRWPASAASTCPRPPQPPPGARRGGAALAARDRRCGPTDWRSWASHRAASWRCCWGRPSRRSRRSSATRRAATSTPAPAGGRRPGPSGASRCPASTRRLRRAAGRRPGAGPLALLVPGQLGTGRRGRAGDDPGRAHQRASAAAVGGG